MFDLYTAKINLAGSLLNQVEKTNLTAPEIHVLRHIHGSDSVSGIIGTGSKVKRTDAQERARLAKEYRNGPDDAGSKLLNEIFGVAGTLPTSIPEVKYVEVEEYDEAKDEAVEAVEEKIERAPRPLAKKAEDANAGLLD